MSAELPKADHAGATDDIDVEKVAPEVADVEPANADGTVHQTLLGDAMHKRVWFGKLNPECAEAVHKDAADVQFTEKEERRVRWKIDRRVLTLVIASYIFNQFDRTNIGNAHVIPAFNKNFGITDNNKWTVALSVFYVGYCLLEMPANVFQRFFMSLSFWGISSLSFVYSKGYSAFLVLRVLLGIGEAGYYAGMIYYLSFWYKSWQFLFLIEAIPTIIVAAMLLLFLPSFPFAATFLTPREKAIAQARLISDHNPQSHGGMNGWQGFKAVILDVNSWLLMLIYATFNVGVATSTYFLPTLIKELGFAAIDAQGLTVAPYVIGWFMVLFQSWHSDRTRDRGYHIMASTFTSFVGYLILATTAQKSHGASYFALFLVIGGNFSLFPLVMSWAANVFSPTSKRGVGTAFIVSISNCVSIASPQIYFDPEDNYRKGHAIAAGALFASFAAAWILRTRLAWKNKTNKATLARMVEEGKAHAKVDVEMHDDDPRYVFMT
ncbi:hypothetical protein EWM64_g4043 [Hericium alpestre]|uniref:Major facilitator superfamily (MFS) profile domain-containing protein n=1 Tax=Hericium alpestre TaxID=135208 RepID=A0A4Z0A0V6_9AGAM|nr:hypothetical protein EWM64_g4043 [Hericium alpestre]